MIRTIGAMTVVVPRNFIATLFIGGSNARSPGFHCFLVASPPVRVLLLFTKHLFVAATVASDGHKTMTGTVVATAMRVPALRSMHWVAPTPSRSTIFPAIDAVEVHGDGADIAGESHAAAVGRDVDLLVKVGAVEAERVGAVLALDDVAGVARVPDERIVAGAEQGCVVARAAVDGELDESGE